MKKNKKGFTLAELLIVVAIIAVLVAIAIPVFTTQLERSREATDLANIRSAYAEAMTDYLAEGSGSAEAAIKQKDAEWHIDNSLVVRVNGTEKPITLANVAVGGTCSIEVKDSVGTTTELASVSIGMIAAPATP